MYVFQVSPVAGGKIVESDDLLVQFEQALHEVRSDKTGRPGDKPAPRDGAQTSFDLRIGAHRGRVSVSGVPNFPGKIVGERGARITGIDYAASPKREVAIVDGHMSGRDQHHIKA